MSPLSSSWVVPGKLNRYGRCRQRPYFRAMRACCRGDRCRMDEHVMAIMAESSPGVSIYQARHRCTDLLEHHRHHGGYQECHASVLLSFGYVPLDGAPTNTSIISFLATETTAEGNRNGDTAVRPSDSPSDVQLVGHGRPPGPIAIRSWPIVYDRTAHRLDGKPQRSKTAK